MTTHMEKIRMKLNRWLGKSSEKDAVSRGRELITNMYIKGNGIEIGALYRPLIVPKIAKVKYVDRMDVPDLRKHYPELNSFDLVNVDIIDNGETLEKIKDGSQDFVIANHFLEHCQNPLLTLQNMLKVLKIGGVVYIAVPDKRYLWIDIDRSVTEFKHIKQDYIDGPENSKEQHFIEWTEYAEKIKEEKAKRQRAAVLMEMDYSIHFHVWTQNEIMEMLYEAKKIFPFEVEMINKNGHEIIFVLSKC